MAIEYTINPDLVDKWRNSLILKSASRLVEMLEEDGRELTNAEAEAFARSLLDSYDQILQDSTHE